MLTIWARWGLSMANDRTCKTTFVSYRLVTNHSAVQFRNFWIYTATRNVESLYSVSRVVYLLVLICLMFCFRPLFIIVLQVIDCVFCVDNMIGMSDTTNIRLKTSNPLRNHTLIHCTVPPYLKVLLNCDSMHRNVCLCLFDNSVMNIFYLIT